MKTQNTPENRANFHALYYGQRIAYCVNSADEIQAFGCLSNCVNDEILYLKTKPLSAISDEDAIEVARIEYPLHPSHHYSGYGKYLCDNLNTSITSNKVHISDFLRSKGYLIGWMDLTPEDILSYGWGRLEGGV